MKKVIVVAPHPDDETLGCGGAILKHKANGDQVYWLIITNVLTEQGWSEERVNSRQKEIDQVASEYGFDGYFKLDFPTLKLDTIPIGDIVQGIAKVFAEVQPEIVYTPYKYDIHTDHYISFNAVYSCTKNFRYPFVKKVLVYETVSETEFSPSFAHTSFVPNVFVDVSDTFERKLEIMKIFESEIMDAPLPRSIESIKNLGKLRGNRIGAKYAESFMQLFEIID